MLQTGFSPHGISVTAIRPSCNHNFSIAALQSDGTAVHVLNIHVRICGEITTDILCAHSLTNRDLILIPLVIRAWYGRE